MLKAVIFDMDGVIVDSEPMHAKAFALTLEKYNIKVPIEYCNQFIGSTALSMFITAIEEFHINATPEELLKADDVVKEQLLKEEGYIAIPFVIDLIKNLNSHGIKLAIASSSSYETIEKVMQALHIAEYFETYISGMQVKKSKPEPDIFLKAAEALQIDKNDCLIIEDSMNGAIAADRAGITCVGLINPHSGNQDLSKASYLIESFEEINYEFLKQVYQITHNEPVIITESKRLVIKELSSTDLDDLYRIYQHPKVKEFIDDLDPCKEVELRKLQSYIQNCYHFFGYGLWGVFLKENGSLIGRCGIENKVINDEPVIELGYLLDNNFWDKGFGYECVTAVLNYCFQTLEIAKITTVIDSKNLRSIKLAEKVGMQKSKEFIKNKISYITYIINNPLL